MHDVPYLTVPARHTMLPGSPVSLAMTLAAHPERWWASVEYRTDTRWYRLLQRTEHHEVWLLSWLPGQGTELHDHGPATGAFAVAAGSLTERVATTRASGTPVQVSRTLDPGRCRVFGPHYVHQVTNTGTVPAVSVHVYTPGLDMMNCYHLALETLHHVSVEPPGVDW